MSEDSMGHDAYMDYLCNEGVAWSFIEDGIWKTREGNILHVEDMDTSHIENCIKLLLRLTEEGGSPNTFQMSWVERFEEELNRRALRK